MCNRPFWLPEIINMDGNWEKKIIELFEIFCRDFEIGKPYYEGLEVWWDKRKIDGNYPEGFWHITTKGKPFNRIPDFRRSERLPWCGPSINNSGDPIILRWDYQENKKIRTYVWLENFDYVIILEKKHIGNRVIAFLVTAFHVDGSRTKSQLKDKYRNRILMHSSP